MKCCLRRTVAVAVTVAVCGAPMLAGGGASAAGVADSPFAVAARVPVGVDIRGMAVDTSNHNVYVLSDEGLEVVDESGDSRNGQVTAIVPQVSGWGMAVDSSSHNVYVLGYDNTVTVVDESADSHLGEVTDVIALPGSPEALAVDPSNHNVYVLSDQGLTVIDESGGAFSGNVTGTIVLGSSEWDSGVAVDPSTHKVYVTDGAEGTVSVIDESGDARSGQVTGVVHIPDPRLVAVDPSDHNVYVTRWVDGSFVLSVIDESGDARNGQVTSTVGLDNYSWVVAVDPSTHDVYIVSDNGQLTVIDESGDANTGRVIGLVDLGAGSDGMGVDPSTHNAYVVDWSGGSLDGFLSVVTASGAIGGAVRDSASGAGIAGACVQVEQAATGVRVAQFQADSTGLYTGTVAPGSYKLIATDCEGDTHATAYYGGADNYDFLSPQAQVVTVTAGTTQSSLSIALPLAGTISGLVTDSTSRSGITGICAYAIDTSENMLRGYSTPTTATGHYNIGNLPPGTDRVAFQPCTIGPYPLTYSNPVTVTPDGVMTVNEPLVHS